MSNREIDGICESGLYIETDQLTNIYIEGEHIKGGGYFDGPFDFYNISSALRSIPVDDIRVNKIILETD